MLRAATTMSPVHLKLVIINYQPVIAYVCMSVLISLFVFVQCICNFCFYLGCISEIYAQQSMPKISSEVDLMLKINVFYR